MALQGEAVAVVGEQLLARCHHGLGRQQLAQGPGQLRPVVAMAGTGPRSRAVAEGWAGTLGSGLGGVQGFKHELTTPGPEGMAG